MSELFQCKKAENCFADAQSFAYTLSRSIDEKMLLYLEKWGTLVVRRNFRRPFFTLQMEKGIQVKGILEGRVLKAGFDKRIWEEQKMAFEQGLELLLADLGGGTG